MSTAIAIEPQSVPAERIDPLRGTAGFLWTLRCCVYVLLGVAIYAGGPLVRIGAVAAMILVPLGTRSGLARHVLHAVGLAVGVSLVPSIGLTLGALLSDVVGSIIGLIVGCAAAVVTPVLVSIVIGRVINGVLREHRYLYVIDRAAGTVLGVAEGAALAITLCWLLTLFEPVIYMNSLRFASSHPTLARVLDYCHDLNRTVVTEDAVGRWAVRRNPLHEVPTLVAMEAVGEIAANREAFWEAFHDGKFDDLLAEPTVRHHYHAFADDAALRHAVKIRDLTTLFGSRQFNEAINDKALCKLVAATWPEVRSRVSAVELHKLRQEAERADPQRARQVLQRAREHEIAVPQ
jgi:hypothetical protein